MSEESSVLKQLKNMVGKEMVVTAPEEVGQASIRYFAKAIDDLNPVYFDEKYAKNTRHQGIIAPPTFVCESMQYLVGDVDEVGGPARRLRLPVGTEIRGGNDYEFFQPLRPDDIMTAHWKVLDVYEKTGQKYGKMYFLVYDITYTNQRNELLAVNHEWLIFLESDSNQN